MDEKLYSLTYLQRCGELSKKLSQGGIIDREARSVHEHHEWQENWKLN